MKLRLKGQIEFRLIFFVTNITQGNKENSDKITERKMFMEEKAEMSARR